MFKITELMIYKVIFVIEILVSMHLFSSKLIRKNKYNLRLTLSVMAVLIISVFFPIFKIVYLTIFRIAICQPYIKINYKSHIL